MRASVVRQRGVGDMRLPRALAGAASLLNTLPLRCNGPATRTRSSPPFTAAVSCPRRCFWNPFASSTASDNAVERRNAEQHAKIVETAHHDANRQNEELLGACLDLLDMCGGTAAGAAPSLTLDSHARSQLWVLVDVLLHDHRRAPAEQFDLVYAALCLPAAREQRQLQRSLHVVLRSVVPAALYGVFESVDLVVADDDAQSVLRRDTLLAFMHTQLGDLVVPDGLEEAEVLSVHVADMSAMFPALASCPAWHAVERDATTIAMQAKLFALLGRLCAELDEEKTGMVKLADLRTTAERVLGSDAAARLLEGAQADKEDRIPYPQLAALLTRPPPKRSTPAPPS